MSHQGVRLAAALAAAAVLLALAPPAAPIFGFTPIGGARERADESRFLDLPSAQGALDHVAALAGRPHYDGTPADRALARYDRDRLAEAGFDARIEPYAATVDTPRRLVLELFADGRPFVPRDGFHRQRGSPPLGLDLREPGDPGDPETLDPAAGLPFDAGAGDGDVFAPLAYVDRGDPADLAALRSAGVDVRGAVVLIRRGGDEPGRAVRRAQDSGAAGALLYDDPADDPSLPPGAIRRDDLGAGVRVPVLPIGAETARVLLRGLRGPAGPPGWAGALDASYPLAKGPAAVRLAVTLNHERRTLWNVVGRLPGTRPGPGVILGAHRDAWVRGAGDNAAGVSSLLETARGLGYLARSGWQPKRGITIAFWDGGELGRSGSAAFGQAHAPELRFGCVAYLDADDDLTGLRFDAAAAGALATAIVGASAAVPDPARERTTLHDRWTAQPRGIRVDEPGADGDGASFLLGFGTPVAAMGFSGASTPGDSGYDTLRRAWSASDPGFVLHRTNAQIYGVVAMRLAAADAVPYAFAPYRSRLGDGLQQLEARALRDGRTLDTRRLRAAIARYAAASSEADAATARGAGAGDARSIAAVEAIDALSYGAGGAPPAFSDLADAYARGDAALAVATDRVTAALDAATRLLR